MQVAQFSEKFAPLFQPFRYKVYYGGRAAGRSWGFARALLLLGVQEKRRVLCARELQNSLTESVHKVLTDQIAILGLSKEYEVQRDRILGRNGTEFFFEGIRNNVDKIKSYEGIDICWVEEADKVSKNSWQTLLPTINRRETAEIWITFNPSLEKNYTYQFFVKDPPKDAVVVKMSYQDNGFLSKKFVEEIEAEYDKAVKGETEDEWLNVWGGFPRRILSGVIYAKELRNAEKERRITYVPWDREIPVDTFWDLGRRDHTSIWFAQRVGMQNRVLDFYEARGEDIHHFIKALQSKPYSYGTSFLPHDARAARLGSKRTIEEIVRTFSPSVRIVPKLSRVDGINAGRLLFPSLWFDEKNCDAGLERLRNYKYAVKDDGAFSEQPLHDENSDAADAFRYMAISLTQPTAASQVGMRLMAPEVREARGSAFMGGLAQKVRNSTEWMRR